MNQIKTVLMTQTNQEIDPFLVGLYNAMVRMGFKVGIWDKNEKSAFDVFSETVPDLLIDRIDGLNRATYKNIQKYPNMKVVLRLDNNEPWQARRNEFYKELQERIVSISACEESNDCASLVRFAIDDIHYFQGPPEPMFESEYVYIGRFADWKVRHLAYLGLLDFSKQLKVFGATVWNLPHYLGTVDPVTARRIYNSAKYSLDIVDEKQNYIGERIYQIAACGSQLIGNSKWFQKVSISSDNDKYINRATQILELIVNKNA